MLVVSFTCSSCRHLRGEQLRKPVDKRLLCLAQLLGVAVVELDRAFDAVADVKGLHDGCVDVRRRHRKPDIVRMTQDAGFSVLERLARGARADGASRLVVGGVVAGVSQDALPVGDGNGERRRGRQEKFADLLGCVGRQAILHAIEHLATELEQLIGLIGGMGVGVEPQPHEAEERKREHEPQDELQDHRLQTKHGHVRERASRHERHDDEQYFQNVPFAQQFVIHVNAP